MSRGRKTANGLENKAYLPDEELGKPGYVQNGSAVETSVVEEEDPWKVSKIEMDYVSWKDLDTRQKIIRAVSYTVKICLVFGLLYLFICSLDFLGSAFNLLGGKAAGEVFQQSDILSNPVAGLMMGVLVTVLVQSSSTSSSIIISMVGESILTIKTAIPIIMGANIGTSVTNTIVAIGQIGDKGEFRRAFAGGTVHDMFNWLTVLVLLPLEIVTGYLFKLSEAMVASLRLNETLDVDQELLKVITKPFTSLIIEIDKKSIEDIAVGKTGGRIMKLCCDKTTPENCCGNTLKKFSWYGGAQNYSQNSRTDVCLALDTCVKKEYTNSTMPEDCRTLPWVQKHFRETNVFSSLNCTALGGNVTESNCCNQALESAIFYQQSMEKIALCNQVSACFTTHSTNATCLSDQAWNWRTINTTTLAETFSCTTWTKKVEQQECNNGCQYLFKGLADHLGDQAIGGILLVAALIMLCACLVGIVKVLNSLLKGPMANLIRKFVNADFPGRCAYFTGYLAILLGAGLTMLIQSSSIFTSTLTPLVGIGVISLERMYPLTLGSNIGTTVTGIMAAMAQDTKKIPRSLQVAFCHLFFNISGIILFYPIPFLRWPIPSAKFLGNTTAKYRWFSVAYLLLMFFLLPAGIFALSIPGWYVLACVIIPIAVIAIIITIIKCFQSKRPGCLPKVLQNWKFLPEPLRSLAPYDRIIQKICICNRFKGDSSQSKDDNNINIATKNESNVTEPYSSNGFTTRL